MKLSKHKSKSGFKKNGSRKKNNLRNNRKFHNSHKKNKRRGPLHKKTLKIYIGGTSDKNTPKDTTPKDTTPSSDYKCKYTNIPFKEKFPEYITSLSFDQQKNFFEQYFNYNDNISCPLKAKQFLVVYLKNIWEQSQNKKNIADLKEIWEKDIDPSILTPEQRIQYSIDMIEITGEKPNNTTPLDSSPEAAAKRAEDELQKINNLKQYCVSNSPKLDDTIDIPLITALSNEITAKTTKSNIAKKENLIKNVNNLDYYFVETTAEGDCMYSSFIYGLLYKKIGNWNKIKGWKPVKDESSGKCNYIGNLRQVLQNYICTNLDELLKTFSIGQLDDAAKRVTQGKAWGEETELKLLGKMFNVCIGVFKKDGDSIKNRVEFFDKTGKNIHNESTNKDIFTPQHFDRLCGTDVVFVYELNNAHFQSVISFSNSNPTNQTNTTDSIPGKKNGLGNIDSCSVSEFSKEIPDSQEEALEILSKIDSIFLHCDISNHQDDAIKVLEFYMEYINNFKNKFNFDPVVISQHCKELFKEDMDYNIVPDSEEEANKKFIKMIDLLQTSQKIDDKCAQSIDLALGIYLDKMLEKYPDINTSTPSSVPDNNTSTPGLDPNNTSPSGIGPDNNTSTPSSVPDNNTSTPGVDPNNTSPSGIGPDNNTSTPGVDPNNTSPSGIGPDNTSTPSSVPDNNTSTPSSVPNNTSPSGIGPDNNTSTPSSVPDNNASPSSNQNFPNTIDDKKISEIFNSITTDKQIAQIRLIRFLTSKTNDNAMLVRHVIGFDEPFTMTDVQVSLGQIDINVKREDWKKNSKIFFSLLNSYDKMKGGGMQSQDGNLTKKDFIKFVNCGQYRDKTKNLFECNNVKKPTQGTNKPTQGTGSTQGTNQSTQGTNQSTQGTGSTQGTNQSSQGTNQSNQGTNQSSQGTNQSNQGTNQSNQGTNQSNQGTGSNQGTIPTAIPVPSSQQKNVEVTIDESEYNSAIKRVDLSIFVPNDSRVIVRDYAKNTESEMISGLSTF
jgi:hypothetical protein